VKKILIHIMVISLLFVSAEINCIKVLVFRLVGSSTKRKHLKKKLQLCNIHLCHIFLFKQQQNFFVLKTI
jgi:hypothetical protein